MKRLIMEQMPRLDVLFIHGDHSLAACPADFDCCRGLLAPAAIVVFHAPASCPAAAWTADDLGIYHRRDVVKAVDQVVRGDGEYRLQTLLEPLCGMAILQRTHTAYRPQRGADVTACRMSGA